MASSPAPAEPPPAKELFGAVTAPAPTVAGSRVFGSYARGCLAGGEALPPDGPGWQAMRPSRNRAFGHPVLVAWLERFALTAQATGWPGLLVGDMAQPRGGPMRTGHASHQLGLDVDIWLTPMPERRLSQAEREEIGARSMIRPGTRAVDPAIFGAPQMALIQAAAERPEVARIFVHPGIKQALCRSSKRDGSWLAKVRPWWGHDSHFHVRLACPAAEPFCRDQDPPPAGDGCGDELAWWLSDDPWRPKVPPVKAPPPLRLADLPAQCREVLDGSASGAAPPVRR